MVANALRETANSDDLTVNRNGDCFTEKLADLFPFPSRKKYQTVGDFLQIYQPQPLRPPSSIEEAFYEIKHKYLYEPASDATLAAIKAEMAIFARSTEGKNLSYRDGGEAKQFRINDSKNWYVDAEYDDHFRAVSLGMRYREGDKTFDTKHYFWGMDRPEDAVRKFIKSNLLIKVNTRNLPVLGTAKVTPEEQKARNLLRDMISEKDWRRYCTNGFIMVQGQSGKWYQVSGTYSRKIRVYDQGKFQAELCIHTVKDCPPTDHVVNMKVLLEIDEQRVWAGSNKALDLSHETLEPEEKKNLVQLYRSLTLSKVAISA